MNINIRPIILEDAKYLHEIRIMDGIREIIMALTSERIGKMQSLISELTDNQHMYVAEIKENGVKKVVGSVGLTVNTSARVRHSGSIGINVSKDYQGKGIGKALLNKAIDLADNWLMLVRLELGVFVDNERAINLYKSLGFVIEGTKKYAIIKHGKYEDELIPPGLDWVIGILLEYLFFNGFKDKLPNV